MLRQTQETFACPPKKQPIYVHGIVSVSFFENSLTEAAANYTVGCIHGIMIAMCDKPVHIVRAYGVERKSGHEWQMSVGTTEDKFEALKKTLKDYFGDICELRFRSYTI